MLVTRHQNTGVGQYLQLQLMPWERWIHTFGKPELLIIIQHLLEGVRLEHAVHIDNVGEHLRDCIMEDLGVDGRIGGKPPQPLIFVSCSSYLGGVKEMAAEAD